MGNIFLLRQIFYWAKNNFRINRIPNPTRLGLQG